MYKKPTIADVRNLSDFLEVSERTARRYLQNPAGMPAPERKLWQMHCNGRILPDHWHGVRFHDGQLLTDTEYKLAYGQIQQYAWHINCLDLLLRDLARLGEKVRELERRGLRLQQRERVKLENLQLIERELTEGLPALCRPAPIRHRADGC